MIRLAIVEDIAAITQMVGAYQREVRPDLMLHSGTVAASIRTLICTSEGCALVVDDGALCGVLLGQISGSLWWPDTSAQVALWWLSPDHRGSGAASVLLDEFEAWAAQSGAARIGATYTGKSARKYLERRGYRYADTSMMKDVN